MDCYASINHNDDTQTPTESMAQAFSALNSALADELIEQIHALSPKFFEQLVVDLMLAMGYGGSQKDASQATQYSNDSGVDGIIKEDKLGLDSIYLQAKRYRDNTVGRPDIQPLLVRSICTAPAKECLLPSPVSVKTPVILLLVLKNASC